MENAMLLGLMLIIVVVLAFFPLGMMFSAFMLFGASVLLVGVSNGAIHLVGGCVLLVGAVLCAACSGIAREIRKLRRIFEVGATSPPVSPVTRVASPQAESEIRPTGAPQASHNEPSRPQQSGHYEMDSVSGSSANRE